MLIRCRMEPGKHTYHTTIYTYSSFYSETFSLSKMCSPLLFPAFKYPISLVQSWAMFSHDAWQKLLITSQGRKSLGLKGFGGSCYQCLMVMGVISSMLTHCNWGCAVTAPDRIFVTCVHPWFESDGLEWFDGSCGGSGSSLARYYSGFFPAICSLNSSVGVQMGVFSQNPTLSLYSHSLSK